MSPARWVLLAGLIGLATLFLEPPSASAQQPTTPPASPAPARTPADQLLDKALQNLGTLSWMETTTWQKAKLQGMEFETTGKFVTAPGRRVYYEKDTNLGGLKGKSRLISDGRTAWHVEEVGSQKAIQKFELDQQDENLAVLALGSLSGMQAGPMALAAVPDVTWFAALQGDDIDRQVREEVAIEHGFAGIRPILQDLQKRITFDRIEPAFWPGSCGLPMPVYQLEGKWNAETRRKILQNPAGDDLTQAWEKGQVLLYLPRRCRLLLGGNLWPYRLEWHGPTRLNGPDELLVASEFRDPILTPPAEPKHSFEFKPSDQDQKLVQSLKLSEEIKVRRALIVRQKELEERAR